MAETLEKLSVCAWCHHIYDDNGKRLVLLAEEDYREIQSHGICLICKTSMLDEMKKSIRKMG